MGRNGALIFTPSDHYRNENKWENLIKMNNKLLLQNSTTPVRILGSVTYHAFYNNMQLVLTAVRAIRGNQKCNSHEPVLKLKL